MTIEEEAREALASAGERLAGAERGWGDAIAGLSSDLGLARAAGTSPLAARDLVTAGGSLGSLGITHLNREIAAWPAGLPGNLPPRTPDATGAGSRDQADELLALAGARLAEGEAILARARARLADAAEFAQHAGIRAGAVHGLVTARAALGDIGARQLAEETGSWEEKAAGFAVQRQDPAVTPAFWDMHLRALAAKGGGHYLAAAAIWQVAAGQLPAGHPMGSHLRLMVTALRTAAGHGPAAAYRPRRDLEPGWTYAGSNRHGWCWQRYVRDRGILRVTARPGGTFSWELGFSPGVPFTTTAEGFTSEGAAMRDAGTQAAQAPPGTFDKLTPAEARALYLKMYRAARHLGTPAPMTGDPDRDGPPDLGHALAELYRRIMVQHLDLDRPGPHPVTVFGEARQWYRVAETTGLRESDFDPAALQAPEAAREHLARAGRHLRYGLPAQADAELRHAMAAAAGSPAGQAIGRLLDRVAAAAGQPAGPGRAAPAPQGSRAPRPAPGRAPAAGGPARRPR